ncbi:MAG: hypothetical protein KDJ67_13865 [Nitratireductor sp.]|nr:hypothetical protein [Nitratireductor sp.]
MSANIEIQFDDGSKLYFGGSNAASGLHEVSAIDNATKASNEKLEKALGSLAGLVNSMEASIARITHKPKKIELEFGASLTTECDLWIVSGEGTAELKVTLTWE